MSTTNFVKLNGISSDATARDVEEFMMYCGSVRTVVLTADAMSETGQSAIVEFENSNGVEMAQLLSGAVFQHHEVHIEPFNDQKKNVETEIGASTGTIPTGIPTTTTTTTTATTTVPNPDSTENYRPPSLLRSAMEAMEKLQERKILSKGGKLLNRLREEAKQVPKGISSVTLQVIDSVESNNVAPGTKATLDQWDYMPTQPQWGKKAEWDDK
ncbi:uncharacterized protein TM35_000431150 [Trypanosoma theileri]|uniref:RRM domain-containing protein n=1 Tax=Trypanosoma theileri TaxID=67003 RepID=A0A1X0NIS8_9TRYP|nr:uncharacterized protein TM35_000431150 [Trypanosoma theileri]ORC84547.1 hypothetical protein TM35_000431150 [Trypanosoma theileri]